MKPYKGYLARVRFDPVSHRWEGEVVGLSAIQFQSRTLEGVESSFHEAVDHYVAQRTLQNLQEIPFAQESPTQEKS